MDESRLIHEAQRGQPAAQRALYDAHVERVYRLAYRMTGDDGRAQDLTQETFVRAFAKLEGFREQAAFSTWLHAIATRVILNGIRKVHRFRQREVEWDEMDGQPAVARQLARTDDQMLKHLLSRAIDNLAAELRLVFVMHDIEGYKHHEIAAALAIPAGTSKTRLHRARKLLRTWLTGDEETLAEEDAS